MIKKKLKNTTAFAFGFLISILILEIFLNLYDPFGFRVEGNKIILPAKQQYIIKNDVTQKLPAIINHQKNSLGFRGDELNSSNNKVKIFAVGGSTTECYYLNDGKDWPNLLQSIINKELANKIWINNAGLDGHSTFGHKILVEDYLVSLKPDILIFYVGINDVGRSDLNEHDASRLKNNNAIKFKEKIKQFFLKKSKLIQVIKSIYRALNADHFQLHHNFVGFNNLKLLNLSQKKIEQELVNHEKYFLPNYEKRLIEIINICKKDHIVPFFISQPALYGEGYDEEIKVDLCKVQLSKNVNGELKWRVLQLYNNKLKEVSNKHNISFIDVANLMNKKSNYFYDWIHYTEDGSLEIAKIISKELIKYLK